MTNRNMVKPSVVDPAGSSRKSGPDGQLLPEPNPSPLPPMPAPESDPGQVTTTREPEDSPGAAQFPDG